MTLMKRSFVAFHAAYCAGLTVCLSVSILICPAFSQLRERDPVAVDRVIENVREGKFGTADLNQIVRAKAVQAIPFLEAQYDNVADPILKEALARTLVKLGDPKQAFWDFLAKNAVIAIDSDAPQVNDFDSQGNAIRGRLSPKFLEWSQANRLEPQAAAEDQVYGMPGHVLSLASTGDSRGVTILRKGLLSHNYFIELISARGLALIGDKASIPFIIDACDKAPSEVASAIARTLVFFEDTNAQKAASRLLNQETLEAFRKLSREKGPGVLFGF